jgi:SHAQKYF class myb-like DNA-binding protein
MSIILPDLVPVGMACRPVLSLHHASKCPAASSAGRLIRRQNPLHNSPTSAHLALLNPALRAPSRDLSKEMTITPRVFTELQNALGASAAAPLDGWRMYSTPTDALLPVVTPPNSRWSAWEHERFLEALELYPSGPWSHVAWHIGSKTARQAMTHAQKYRQRLRRRQKREEALQRLQEARQVAEAHASALAEPVIAHELVGAIDEAKEDALLSMIAAVLALPASVAASHDEHQTSNEVVAVSNETASVNDPVLEDLLRWMDQFFEN